MLVLSTLICSRLKPRNFSISPRGIHRNITLNEATNNIVLDTNIHKKKSELTSILCWAVYSSRYFTCGISGSHGGDCEVGSLLGFWIVALCGVVEICRSSLFPDNEKTSLLWIADVTTLGNLLIIRSGLIISHVGSFHTVAAL